MSLSEKDLVTKIETILQKQFNTELTFREVSAGYGIADLVIAPDGQNSDAEKRNPITSFGMLQFLLLLDKSGHTLQGLIELSPFTPLRELRKYINFLVKNGYIRYEDGKYRIVSDICTSHPIQKIIAIEAKLTDYKNGIIQAKRYQYFADQSYLAILKKAARHIDVQELTDSGIGLIVFDEVDETIEIFEPHETARQKERSYNLFAKEVMLSRMVVV